MLHGLMVDHRLVKGCMEPVFHNCPTVGSWKRIYLDLPGMGQTRGSAWVHGSDDVLDLLTEFINDLLPNQRFVLVGQSYGGYLAKGLIRRLPGMVDGLLLICPVTLANRSDRTVAEHRVAWRDEGLRDRLDDDELRRLGTLVVQTKHTWKRYLQEVYVGVESADLAFLQNLAVNYRLSCEPETAGFSFDKPTLILLGRQDCIVGYEDAWRLMPYYPRASLVVLDGAGHNLQIEQEHLFTELVRNWLLQVQAVEDKP